MKPATHKQLRLPKCNPAMWWKCGSGEVIAVDGIIHDGVGFVSESAVSGEPFAVVRRPGDRVLAGSASFDAIFRITATAKGTEREIDRLLTVVEEAA